MPLYSTFHSVGKVFFVVAVCYNEYDFLVQYSIQLLTFKPQTHNHIIYTTHTRLSQKKALYFKEPFGSTEKQLSLCVKSSIFYLQTLFESLPSIRIHLSGSVSVQSLCYVLRIRGFVSYLFLLLAQTSQKFSLYSRIHGLKYRNVFMEFYSNPERKMLRLICSVVWLATHLAATATTSGEVDIGLITFFCSAKNNAPNNTAWQDIFYFKDVL